MTKNLAWMLLAVAGSLPAQNVINGKTTFTDVVTFQRPATLAGGTTLPSTCPGLGATFFKTDATPGQNLYAVTNLSPCTWTQQAGGGGGGTGDAAVYSVVTFSATPTFAATSNTVDVFNLTLTGNVTSSTLTVTSGNPLVVIRICQDATGGRTAVLPATVLGFGTLDATAHYCTAGMGTWNGTNVIVESTEVTKDDGGRIGQYVNLTGSSSGATKVGVAAAASGTLTLPSATDTLVGRATTDTLTNKTISGASNTLSPTSAQTLAGFSGTCNSSTYARGDGACAAAGGSSAYGTVTFSATPTFAITSSTVHSLRLTLTGDVTSSTLTVSSADPWVTLEACQDATGSHTLVWPTTVLYAGTIDATAHYCTAVSGYYDGTNLNVKLISVTKDDGTRIGSGIVLQGSSSGTTTVQPAAAASGTLTLPAATDTLVGRATTDTLTGKTMVWGSNTIGGIFPCNSPGLGDGTNAIAAATYLQTNCYNSTGRTVTISGIKCYTDNNGSSTLNVTNGAGGALLTGAVTCTTSFASGTQSGTTTIANGDVLKFTFVADGTSKQGSFVVLGTF